MSKIKQLQEQEFATPIRKFLITNSNWRTQAIGLDEILELNISSNPIVKVQTISLDANISIYDPNGTQIFRCAIPFNDASAIIDINNKNIITKIRYAVYDSKHWCTWYIDEYRGNHSGLVIGFTYALESTKLQTTNDWLGEEITHNKQYINN